MIYMNGRNGRSGRIGRNGRNIGNNRNGKTCRNDRNSRSQIRLQEKGIVCKYAPQKEYLIQMNLFVGKIFFSSKNNI